MNNEYYVYIYSNIIHSPFMKGFMSKKTKDKISVKFCGGNAWDVTGSMIYIETPHRRILLECGLWQSTGSTLENWKINTRKFDFRPNKIDYLFSCDRHIDHTGLIPRLYNSGATCPIIAPCGSKQIAEILMRDSARIIASDAELLSQKLGRAYEPFYVDSDVDVALGYWTEYDDKPHELDEFIKFKFTPSGHIPFARQLELWITEGNVTKKIVYTSDLGNIHLSKPYTKPYKSILGSRADIAIVESTYAHEPRIANKTARKKDFEKLRSVITETCIDKKRRVLIPSFALARTQEIVTVLYDIFSEEDFGVPVYVDSPMAQKISDAYLNTLEGDALEKWKSVLDWKNLHFVGDYIESRELRDSGNPCIVVASSGFMIAGRSVAWCASLLPHAEDRIVTIGYAPPGSMAYTIKQGEQKTVSITGKRYANRCQVTNLTSFSSHIQRDSMVTEYGKTNAEKLFLVHGDMEGRRGIKEEIEIELSKNDLTTKVIVVEKNMVVNI